MDVNCFLSFFFVFLYKSLTHFLFQTNTDLQDRHFIVCGNSRSSNKLTDVKAKKKKGLISARTQRPQFGSAHEVFGEASVWQDFCLLAELQQVQAGFLRVVGILRYRCVSYLFVQ